MDDEMEEIAAKLLSEWDIDPSSAKSGTEPDTKQKTCVIPHGR
jgi:hypothetical protein